jgi:hypothetical protein
LVKSKVGSFRGTKGEDGTTSCPFFAKNSKKAARMSLVVCMNLIWALWAAGRSGHTPGAGRF